MINFPFSIFKHPIPELVFLSIVFIALGVVLSLGLNYQTLIPEPQSQYEEEKATPKVATYSGTIKPLGPSIYAEGTHFLENAAGEVITILQSAKIDLSFFEGQTVAVEGTVKDSVEGNQTVLEVEKILL